MVRRALTVVAQDGVRPSRGRVIARAMRRSSGIADAPRVFPPREYRRSCRVIVPRSPFIRSPTRPPPPTSLPLLPRKAKKCNEAALSLLVCMEKTACVQSKRMTLEECMRDPIESDPCLAVRNAYYNCKHSALDMRKRIRGVRQY